MLTRWSRILKGILPCTWDLCSLPCRIPSRMNHDSPLPCSSDSQNHRELSCVLKNQEESMCIATFDLLEFEIKTFRFWIKPLLSGYLMVLVQRTKQEKIIFTDRTHLNNLAWCYSNPWETCLFSRNSSNWKLWIDSHFLENKLKGIWFSAASVPFKWKKNAL